ncbi:aldolase/citrate lyase family protein [Rhizobium sp. FKL33]|uniref:aldolase/citrate lyase family protein n=1 Tax=Rhizobium sp. FKL33 TaxID=2562307 RepID=UPI0010C04E6F|nr:aldolase/citrate lyase family protein [Rhizobium sp. FKL33]
MNQGSIPRPTLARLRWFEEGRPPLTLAVVDGESDHLAAELQSALSTQTDGLLVRNCAGLAGLERVETALRVAEARLGLAEGATRLIASMADTARAVLALQKPVIASPRLIGLTWDRSSLRASLGCSDPSPLLDQARLQLLFAAAAAGVPAFEWSVSDDPKSDEDTRALGFAGVSIG